MRIYPAIDIKDGNCVRLLQGRFSDVTVYGDNPVDMAKKWESMGGEFIHVVDLDGALKGHGVNAEIIKSICASVNVTALLSAQRQFPIPNLSARLWQNTATKS